MSEQIGKSSGSPNAAVRIEDSSLPRSYDGRCSVSEAGVTWFRARGTLSKVWDLILFNGARIEYNIHNREVTASSLLRGSLAPLVDRTTTTIEDTAGIIHGRCSDCRDPVPVGALLHLKREFRIHLNRTDSPSGKHIKAR